MNQFQSTVCFAGGQGKEESRLWGEHEENRERMRNEARILGACRPETGPASSKGYWSI